MTQPLSNSFVIAEFTHLVLWSHRLNAFRFFANKLGASICCHWRGGAAFCIATAFFVDSFNFPYLSPDAIRRAEFTDFFVPLVLASGFIFLLMFNIRRLAIARNELAIIAATDSLTKVLNRGAFLMLVDAYLKDARAQVEQNSGALLIVDADHFKSINDQLGHNRGDEALRLIAQTIKAQLHGADIVGRIGGEEFGVFLPGANRDQTKAIAESIRRQIREADFCPEGTPWPLSVSIGGIAFQGRTTYEEIFGAADRRLYNAKASGRDRVVIDHGAVPTAIGGEAATIH